MRIGLLGYNQGSTMFTYDKEFMSGEKNTYRTRTMYNFRIPKQNYITLSFYVKFMMKNIVGSVSTNDDKWQQQKKQLQISSTGSYEPRESLSMSIAIFVKSTFTFS